eukprot:TCONS_00013424-protein
MTIENLFKHNPRNKKYSVPPKRKSMILLLLHSGDVNRFSLSDLQRIKLIVDEKSYSAPISIPKNKNKKMGIIYERDYIKIPKIKKLALIFCKYIRRRTINIISIISMDIFKLNGLIINIFKGIFWILTQRNKINDVNI